MSSLAPRLSSLDLRGNRLISLTGLSGLCCLAVLDVSHNELDSLDGLEGCPGLVEVNASANRIQQPNLLPWGPPHALEGVEVPQTSSGSGDGLRATGVSGGRFPWPYQVLRKLRLDQNSILRLENLPPMPALIELGLQVRRSRVMSGGCYINAKELLPVSLLSSSPPSDIITPGSWSWLPDSHFYLHTSLPQSGQPNSQCMLTPSNTLMPGA